MVGVMLKPASIRCKLSFLFFQFKNKKYSKNKMHSGIEILRFLVFCLTNIRSFFLFLFLWFIQTYLLVPESWVGVPDCRLSSATHWLGVWLSLGLPSSLCIPVCSNFPSENKVLFLSPCPWQLQFSLVTIRLGRLACVCSHLLTLQIPPAVQGYTTMDPPLTEVVWDWLRWFSIKPCPIFLKLFSTFLI